MDSLTEPRATDGEPAVVREDPSLGDALERVFEAGQALIVRRIDLLAEELSAHRFRVLTTGIVDLCAAAHALAGWFIAIAGLIDWLDDHFARHAVEVGAVHLRSVEPDRTRAPSIARCARRVVRRVDRTRTVCRERPDNAVRAAPWPRDAGAPRRSGPAGE